MSYRKEQKAYHALLAMEGHHVHQHSRGGVSDKISTWVRHNVTHRHKLPPTDDGGARVEDAFDALGDGIKHYDDIKVLADRIKRHRSADDMKLLQKLVGTDAQLRSRAIQNHAIDNLITVILRSKAVEPRQVAKETIAALLPGKVSDIAQYVIAPYKWDVWRLCTAYKCYAGKHYGGSAHKKNDGQLWETDGVGNYRIQATQSNW